MGGMPVRLVEPALARRTAVRSMSPRFVRVPMRSFSDEVLRGTASAPPVQERRASAARLNNSGVSFTARVEKPDAEIY
jgi:hypothetical protein